MLGKKFGKGKWLGCTSWRDSKDDRWDLYFNSLNCDAGRGLI
jgi:hypothetical protein